MARKIRRQRTKKMHPDTVRLAALRTMLRLAVSNAPRELRLGGKEQEFRQMLAAGEPIERIADMLQLSPDEAISSLWRSS